MATARVVYLSYTSDLAQSPAERSFVTAAEAAVKQVGDAVRSMERPTASPMPSRVLVRDWIRRADVFVLLVGFRFGSRVADRPLSSYSEFEFDTAGEIGLPRLVFLLAEDAPVQRPLIEPDAESSERQTRFRQRLLSSGLTTTTVSTPEQLETALVRALLGLARARAAASEAPLRVEPVPGRAASNPVPVRRLLVPRPPSFSADVDSLAALLSPGSRLEPELLRAVRLECLPELPVDVEQDLWFGPHVDARSDAGITFAAEPTRELRGRLRTLYDSDARALVTRAHDVMREVHAGVSPLLRVEEELAWTEVFGDDARAAEIADQVVRAVAAGREGAEHWVARVWPTLPAAVRSSRSGWVIGQIAGARDGPASPGVFKDHELRALIVAVPNTDLLLSRRAGLITFEPPPGEAEASIDVPDTRPRVVEVTVGDAPPQRLLIDEGLTTELEVGDAAVQVRTLAGDVYVLGDARQELLDSVLLGSRGAWCVTGVADHAAVLGTAVDLDAALAGIGPTTTPVDLAPYLGFKDAERAGRLFALPLDSADSPQSAGSSGSGVSTVAGQTAGQLLATLARRAEGAFEADMVVRTLARTPRGVEPTTLRTAALSASALVLVDAAGADLVVGAPVVDDDDRLIGVVVPVAWFGLPAAVRSYTLAGVLAQVSVEISKGVRPMSRELLMIMTGGFDDPPPESIRISGAGTYEAARTAQTAWLVHRHPDDSVMLTYHMGGVAVSGSVLRRKIKLTHPSALSANDASRLLHALGPTSATVRLLTEDEARLVASFVAGLNRTSEPQPGPQPIGVTASGPPAARVGDPTGHPGVLAPPGIPTVLICGSPAATVGTMHICSFPPPAVHPPTPVVPPGATTVLIGGLPAARMGDLCGCGAPIVMGAPTVLIG